MECQIVSKGKKYKPSHHVPEQYYQASISESFKMVVESQNVITTGTCIWKPFTSSTIVIYKPNVLYYLSLSLHWSFIDKYICIITIYMYTICYVIMTLLWLFLSLWASSTTRQSQLTLPSRAVSILISSYDVSSTWNLTLCPCLSLEALAPPRTAPSVSENSCSL